MLAGSKCVSYADQWDANLKRDTIPFNAWGKLAMAVLVEAISVIIRVEVLVERFPGGWKTFEANPPNATLCADGDLVRVGFMAPPDVAAYGQWLEGFGIRYVVDGNAADLVVAEQRTGFTAPCNWAEFGHIPYGGDPHKLVSACQAIGSRSNELVTPDGWCYENSLSHKHGFVRRENLSEFLDFHGHTDGLDVCTDIETGKRVYIGRASPH